MSIPPIRSSAALLIGVALALGGVSSPGLAPAEAAPRAGRLPAVAGAAVAGPVASTVTSAAAATGTRITDVNGDGLADIVYSGRRMANPDNIDDDTQIGYLAVRYGGARLPEQQIVARDLHDAEGEGSFASAAVSGDLNRDGCADVVVADPQSWDGHAMRSRGKVWVLWGSPTGISAARSRLLLTGVMYTGGALAFVPKPDPVLAVSDPRSIGGSVRIYPVRSNGELGRFRRITLASSGIAGPARQGAGFGSALAATRSLLVVGAPFATAGGVRKAGAAYVLRLGKGLTYRATRLSQADRGVPGKPEKYDRFGSAVSVHQGYVAVGVPSEDIGTVTQAGEIQAFRVTGSGSRLVAKHLRTVTQSSLGLPGFTTGRDHWWGRSVAVYRPCTGAIGVLSVGSSNVRSAVRLPLTLAGRCPAAIVASGGYVNHHIGILRTSQNGATAESTVFSGAADGFLVTAPDGTSVLWPTLFGAEQPAPPAA